jgi:hypothetical protein
MPRADRLDAVDDRIEKRQERVKLALRPRPAREVVSAMIHPFAADGATTSKSADNGRAPIRPRRPA